MPIDRVIGNDHRADPQEPPPKRAGRATAVAGLLACALALAACGGGADLAATDASPPAATDASAGLDEADRASVARALVALGEQAQAAQLGDAQQSATTERKQALALNGRPTIPTLLPPVLDAYCRADWSRCGTIDADERLRTANGQQRHYVLWRPHTARLRNQIPLVVMLHGTSGDGGLFFDISGWREKALREGLIVAFPSALTHCYFQDEGSGMTRHVLSKWADGQLGTTERPLCTDYTGLGLDVARRLADDVGFFRRMVSKIKQDHPRVDLKRVYVTGFSNGAAMAGRLAAEASHEIAAAACHASAVPWQVVEATHTLSIRPISILHSIGTEDEEQKGRLGFPDTPIPLAESLLSDPVSNPVSHPTAYYNGVVLPFAAVLRLNPAAYSYSTTPLTGYARGPVVNVATSRFTFSDALQRGRANAFESWIIDGATHEYPNGKNHPVILAEHVWSFFEGKRLP